MLPILGVCYGAQYLSYRFGGEVKPSASREYGRAAMNVLDKDNQLLSGLSDKSQVWMSHGDTITSIPSHYRIIANTDNIPVAAFQIEGEPTWGIQFPSRGVPFCGGQPHDCPTSSKTSADARATGPRPLS